jgi:hypothetical protein
MSMPVPSGLSIRKDPDGLEVVSSNGPVLRYSTDERYRPHVHPLYVPGTDRPLTRVRPADHPWQFGAYVGLNDVNGQDFWCCGDAYYPAETRGTIRNRTLEADERNGDGVELTVVNDWHHVSGRRLAEEHQSWLVWPPAGSTQTIDVTWELHALDEPLHLGRYDYGGLTLRIVGEPETRRLLDSEGRRDEQCTGEPARWVSAAQPVDGVGAYVRDAPDLLAYSYAGVAVFDHPENAGTPSRWRLEGLLHNPTPQAGWPIDVAAGASIAYRYRLLLFLGEGDADELAGAYERWVA